MWINFLIIFAIVFEGKCTDVLNITVYYESECPYSKNFFQTQLKPSYNLLKDLVHMTYVPYGKASFTKSGTKIYFTCQHGQRECEGNMWELCAFKLIGNDQSRQTFFVICDMSFHRSRELCTLAAGLRLENVRSCILNEGIALMLEADRKTKPVLAISRRLPTIVYNDKYEMYDDISAKLYFYKYTRLKYSEWFPAPSYRHYFRKCPVIRYKQKSV